MDCVEVLRKHRDRLLQTTNVVGVGRGVKVQGSEPTEREAIVVLVTEKLPDEQLSSYDRVPRSLAPGVQTDVIEVGQVKALMPSKRQLLQRHGSYRPTPGGVSIGHIDTTAGTFGCVVKDAEDGSLLILSNNHVLVANSEQPTSDDLILQPGPYDGGEHPEDTIGHLHRYVPISTELSPPTCPVADRFQKSLNAIFRVIAPQYSVQLRKKDSGYNRIDAAVARPISEDMVSREILELGILQGLRKPKIGMKIYKSGRSTGLNWGYIRAVDVSMKINMAEGLEAVFEDQILTDPIAQAGDSGSVMVDEETFAVGLLSAGSAQVSVGSRMDVVLEMLNVSL